MLEHPHDPEYSGPKNAHHEVANNLNVHERIAVRIARMAGNPFAIYISFAFSCLSLPSVLASHSVLNLIAWCSGTCFQLVMLFVLQTDARIGSKASEEQSKQAFHHQLVMEHNLKKILTHLGIK